MKFSENWLYLKSNIRYVQRQKPKKSLKKTTVRYSFVQKGKLLLQFSENEIRCQMEPLRVERVCPPCDVLVIGGGGAGLRAAIAAVEAHPGARVALVVKGALGKCGVTARAVSDRMAFHVTLPYTLPEGPDNWTYHARDIYEIGGRVSDGDLAVILAKDSASALLYLDALGVPFVKGPDGRFDQFVTDGSDYPRACYTGPETAIHIEQALLRKLRTLPVTIYERVMITRLLVDQKGIQGAIGLGTGGDSSGRLHLFPARSVILATGGAGQAFKIHVYPEGATGDGYALAYEVGAELVNMEFQQIGLCSLKTRMACSGSLLRAMPRIIDETGQEFLLEGQSPLEVILLTFRKGASWPLSAEKPTTILDILIFRHLLQGHRVLLDYSRNPQGFDFETLPFDVRQWYEGEIRQSLGKEARQQSPLHRLREINPSSIRWLARHGIDLEGGDPIEIAPAIQHFQGGVKIREQAQTSVAGLYAAGECAGGQHGANRPGGNALLDTQVFGRIAGEQAALYARSRPDPVISSEVLREEIARLEKAECVPTGIPASEFRARVQEILYQYASVIRTEEGLQEGLGQLEDLRRRGIRVDRKGWAYWQETRNITLVAEMILRSALQRRCSLGPHLFFQRPDDLTPVRNSDPQWRQYLIVKKTSEGMQISWRTPVPLAL